MSKKSRFRGTFDKEHDKHAETLLKYASHHLDQIPRTQTRYFICKKSLLQACQTLELLVNTLAADEKYPVPNRDNLMRGIQIQLSQKQKSFSEFIVEFLKFRLNFEDFEKKDDSHSFCVSEITDCENVVR